MFGRPFFFVTGVILACHLSCAQEHGNAQDRVFREIRRFDAPEARQGIAVDAEHFFVITNTVLAKYDKTTGKLVKRWEASDEEPLVHLNAGVVIDGKLYCAHSTYPAFPRTSSVEIWDPETLEHIDNHSFGITNGSLTWIDQHAGAWWAVFSHYSKKVGIDGRTKGTAWTRLVKFDMDWHQQQSWAFPEEVLARLEPRSNSGGAWGDDGRLYCTGHDATEMYALELPKAGSILRLTETIPITITGQAFAWDPFDSDIVYGLDKQKRQVVVSRLVPFTPVQLSP
jgi:hypothetical protein